MKRRNFLASAQKKAYQSKRFGNPEAPTKKRSWRWRFIIGSATLLIATASIPFMLAFAPVFTFNSVEVTGLTSLPDSAVTDIIFTQMEKKRYRIFPQNNQFYFNDTEVFSELNTEHDFAHLEVIVEGRGVRVIAEEKIIELVWLAGDTYYFLDLEGALARPLDETERLQINSRLQGSPPSELEPTAVRLQPNMPIIRLMVQGELIPGMQLVDEQFVATVLAFDKGVRRYRIVPSIYELQELRSDFLRLKSSASYDLLFSTTESATVPLESLDVILKDYEDRLTEISYIDLRFGNHVYIK